MISRAQGRREVLYERDVEIFQLFCQPLRTRLAAYFGHGYRISRKGTGLDGENTGNNGGWDYLMRCIACGNNTPES